MSTRPSSAASRETGSVDSLGARLSDLASKESTRADKLQRRLDEEKAVSAALRQQLKNSTNAQQHLQQQLRSLQGAPGAHSAPVRDGNRSVPQLEKQVAKLQDALDVEKRHTNAERTERQRLAGQLSDQAKLVVKLEASRDDLQRTLARKSTELRRAHNLLREGGQVHDTTLAELSAQALAHERERQQLHSQLTHTREELELERLRATVATRRLEEDAPRHGGWRI